MQIFVITMASNNPMQGEEQIKENIRNALISLGVIPSVTTLSTFPSIEQTDALISALYMNTKWREILGANDFANNNIEPFILPWTQLAKKPNKRWSLNWYSDIADKTMTYAFFLFNALALSLSIAALLSANPGPLINELAGPLVAGQSWNYLDTGGAFIIGLKQIQDKQYTDGGLNIFSSAQMLACTLAAIIGRYATHTVSSVASTALLGFSFAAAMFISAFIEQLAIWRLQKEIQTLEGIDNPNHCIEPEIDGKQIHIKRAKVKDHERNRNAWLLCGVAMTAVAVASVFSFGAPIIALAVTAGVALAISAIRIYWLESKKDSHLKQELNNQFIPYDKYTFFEKLTENPTSTIENVSPPKPQKQ